MLKIRPNGDMIVDAKVTDASVDGLKDLKVIKCPNLYGTAFEVWENQDLATIFGTGEVLEPEAFTTFATVIGHNYYDTYTGTITAGTGDDVTITNTGETAVTVYIVDLTTLFTTEPNETQMDDMTKMFLFNGTGSELITLESVWYIDYSAEVIHNLTTIYGAGNEPSLETHETLIPQYTNTVLKAKAFENTLQQEYMQIGLDTPIYEGLSLRDIFENGNLAVNGDFSDGVSSWNNYLSPNTMTFTDKITFNGTATNSGGYYQDISGVTGNDIIIILGNATKNGSSSPSISIYDYGTFNNGLTTILFNDKYLETIHKIDGIRFYIRQVNTNIYDNAILDNLFILEKSLFTTAPSRAQLDEWLDMYLTLKGSTTNTGTEFYQDRFYIDYDNAKVYDYNIISPYVSETPTDKEAFMAQVIAKTITLTALPVKAKIYKDRFVILGDYVVVGE